MSWLSHQSCLWSDVSSCVRWVWLYWVRWLTANTPSADLGLCQGPGGCIKPPSCTRQQQPLLLRITEMLPLLNVAYISWSRPQSQFSFLTVWQMSLLCELYRWAAEQCDWCHPAAASIVVCEDRWLILMTTIEQDLRLKLCCILLKDSLTLEGAQC